MKKILTILVAGLSILLLFNCGTAVNDSGKTIKQTKATNNPWVDPSDKRCETKQGGSCGSRERKITNVSCENGDTGGSLSALVSESNGDETFVLTNDCVEASPIVISKHRITIEGNGKTIRAEDGSKPVLKIVFGRDIIVRDVNLKGGRIGLWVDSRSSVAAENLTITDSNEVALLLGKRLVQAPVKGGEPDVIQLQDNSKASINNMPSIKWLDHLSLKPLLNHGLNAFISTANAGVKCFVRNPNGTVSSLINTVSAGNSVAIADVCGQTKLVNNVSGILVNDSAKLKVKNNVNITGNNSGYGLRIVDGLVSVQTGSELIEQRHGQNLGLEITNISAQLECDNVKPPKVKFKSGYKLALGASTPNCL